MNELFELFLGPYGVWKFGAVLATLYVLAYILSWAGHWFWLWIDDKEGPPEYNIFSATWWPLLGGKVDHDYGYIYRNKGGSGNDGSAPFLLGFVFIFLLCLSIQFYEVTIGLVAIGLVGVVMRSGRRLSKKLNAHIEDKNAHKEE